MTSQTSTPPDELAFSFLHASHRPPEPRTRGVTEIRGPYLLGLEKVMFEAADPECPAGMSRTTACTCELIECASQRSTMSRTRACFSSRRTAMTSPT